MKLIMDYFSNYHESHLRVIDVLKGALYRKDETLFNRLDFHNDSIYEEPLLYACINNPRFSDWIDSLIMGLSNDKGSLKTLKVPVFDGISYLPTVGYFYFPENYNMFLEASVEDNKFIFKHDDKILNYTFKKIQYIDESTETFECNHPLLRPLFRNERGKIIDVIISGKECYKQEYLDNFSNALSKIEKTYPEYHKLVKNYIKKVVFYKGESNSFATIQAHGIAFFNISHGHSEIFFLDNILHQCAHVFFNTLTFDKKDLFQIPYNSDLSLFTENLEDKGIILYDRFHGLFTQSNINICFNRCLDQQLYSGDNYLEFIAKFTSNMNRFAIAIKKFNKEDKYGIKGLEWFNFFNNTFYAVFQKNKELLSKYDVSNQPYIFDFNLFKTTNTL